MGAVGQDIPHDSARTHVSGETIFLDDIPPLARELLVEPVGSPVAHGRLKNVDYSEALKVPGIVGIYTHKDIRGHKHFGPILPDEHLLVESISHFLGDPILLIAGESREAIKKARKLIKIEIEPLEPIFSIEDAIKAKSFIGPKRVIETGNIAGAFKSCEHILEGEFDIGGQEHFYLESQVALAAPGEAGQMVIQSSTQHPTEVQSLTAEILGVPFNHVIVHCKRMGGGFGGKETQAAQPAMMAALVAQHTNRPTRVVYNKDDDMRFTGKRHPFKAYYKVGFSGEGRIDALELDLYSNGGCTCDLSPSILERAMLHSDNAYYLKNARITGQICKTHLPSNTAFRGFGGPQGVASIENIMQEISRYLQKDSFEVRQLNCYGIDDRHTTPYGQIVRNNVLPRLFDQLRRESDYDRRRKDVAQFNRTSRTHLRGLAMSPIKFGISFTKKFLNQANALVNVYTDGTVMVSHGGTEMGQGLNTHIRQLVADDLGISYDAVIVTTTSTDKNNNTSPTAASSGTDLNGAAALDATSKIKARLADLAATILMDNDRGLDRSPMHMKFEDGFVFDDRAPDRRIEFAKLARRAYEERISIGERGFYATPGVDFNRETGKGTPFLYYTNGAAVSEVLIDRFTGEFRVKRVDLLMDIGVALNPGLDRGQVVGGFIQGMGWVTTEELKYAENGDLLSHSPTTYKIPNITDTPEVFNVKMLDNPDNVVSLKKSKAVGEPPLLLGIAVWSSISDALNSLAGQSRSAKLALPATSERVLMTMTKLISQPAPQAVSVTK